MAAATVLGALGAHALQRLPPDQLHAYDTAVRYHFFHALGLLAIGLTVRTGAAALAQWSAGLIVAGIVLFSGSLYAVCFGAPHALGWLTPIGGLTLIVGWLVFAAAMLLSS
jgi:uncharacterized membrane protein YgdD (TMEM256/DUF423 family)